MLKTNVVRLGVERQTQLSEFLKEQCSTINRMQKRVGEIHADVNQRYDEMPYSFHTNMVANIFMQYGSVCFESKEDIENYVLVAVFAALFHDTIEDARLTYNDVKEIAKEFLAPNLVGADKAILAADIVYALTNEKGKNRAERENDKYFEGIRATPFASCIKLCDRYANALYANTRGSSLAGKYGKEMTQFLSRLTFEIKDGGEIPAMLNIPFELYTLLQHYPFIK